MKSGRRSPVRGLATLCACVALGGGVVLPRAAHAADVVKANNTDALNLGTSWTLGATPGTGDVGVWDSAVTGANSVALGGNLSWQGLRLASPGGDISLTGTNTLTLGSAGLDTGNVANLTYGSSGTITLNGPLAGSTSLTINNNVTKSWTGMNNVTFAGTLVLRGGSGGSGAFSGNWISFGSTSLTQTGSFALDTGASLTDRGEIIVTEGWGTGGVKPKLALSSLTGFGDFRSDFGSNTIRTVLVDQSVNTTFQGRFVSNTYGSRAINLEKAGTGTLELTGASTINSTAVTAGTLKVSGNGTIGSGRPLSIAAGATFDWARAAEFNSAISGAGTILRSTTGNAVFSGANSSFAGDWLITAGYVGLVNDASVGASSVGMTFDGGGIYFTTTGQTLAATRTVTLGLGGGLLNGSTNHVGTFAAKFTGLGGLTKVSGSTAVLTGENDFTGPVTLTTGTLEIGGAGTLGGAAGVYGNTISTASGTRLAVSTSATQTLGGVVSGAGAVAKSGTGTLILAAENTYSGGTTITGGTLQVGNGGTVGVLPGNPSVDTGATLAFARGDAVTFGGVISGAGSVTQAGPGILTLSGSSNYTGGTTVTGGRLNLTGSLASNVTVESGGGISGSGTTTGSLTVNAGGGLVLPGGATTTSFSAAGVTIGAAATLAFASAPTGSTAYDVVTYGAGGLTGLGNLSAPYRGTFSDDTVGQKVVFTTGEVGARTWSTGTGTWSVGGGNWTGGDDLYFDGDSVTFGAIGSDATVTLSGTLLPGAVTVANAANVYTFATGSLTGGMTLAKSGAGTLRLESVNSFTGNTTITAGTLTIGGSGSLGVYAGGIANAGVLAIDTTATQTLAGVISGTGSVTKANSGTTILTGSSTYTGPTTITAGTLQIGEGAAAGSIGSAGVGAAGNAVTVDAGATLLFDRTGTLDYKATPRMRHVAGGGDIVVTGGVKLFNYTGSGAGFADSNSWSNFSGRLIVTEGSEFQTIRNGRTAMGTAQIVLGDATTSGKLSQIEGNWTWTNDIQLVGAANEIINNATGSGRFLKLQGVLSGSGNVALEDATGALNSGNLGIILTGASTLSGTLTVDTFVRVGGVGGDSIDTGGGTSGSLGPDAAVVINSGKRLTFSRTDSHVVPNAISGAGGVHVGAGGLSGTASQNLTLSGNNSFSGGLTVNVGTLTVATINDAAANGPLGNSAGAVILGSSGGTGTLAYTGATAATTKPFTAATGGTAVISVTQAGTVLTLSGLLDGDGAKTFGGVGEIVVAGGISGAGTVSKTGTGVLTLTGSGHAGAFAINQGTLNVNAASALGSATSLSLAAGVTLDNSSPAAVTVNNATLAIGLGSSLTFLGTRDLSLGTGPTTLAANAAIDVTAGTLTFGGEVGDGGGGFGITKSGAGTLVLAGLSGGAFTGNSVVNAGELFLSGTSTLGGGAGTTVTLNPGGTLRIGATASTGGVALVMAGGQAIYESLQPGPRTFTVNQSLVANDDLSDGVQTIAAGVVVSSAADWLGSIPATATPGRIVMENGATLRSTNAVNINVNKGISLSGASATFDADTGSIFVNPQVTGPGKLVKTGTGGFRILNQANDYAGGTDILEGTFGIYGDGSLGQAGTSVFIDGATLNSGQGTSGQTVTIGSARSLLLGNGKTSNLDATNGSTLAYAGVITEADGGGTAASLRIGTAGSRAGTVELGGANTYRGDTIVNAGTLALTSGGSFANSPRIIVGDPTSIGAVLDLSARSTFAIGASQTLMGGGTVALGAGTLTVSGTFAPGNSPGLFTYSGGTTLLAGTTELEIWGTTRATSPTHGDGFYDAVDIVNAGSLDFNESALNLSFDSLFAQGDLFELFKVFDTAALAGNFGSVSVTGDFYTDLTWSKTGTGWASSAAAGGESFVFTAATGTLVVVPEPGSLAVAAGLGLAGLSMIRRHRRRRLERAG